jgi:hypothetical protein
VAICFSGFTENQNISKSDFAKIFGIELGEVKQFENDTISIKLMKK